MLNLTVAQKVAQKVCRDTLAWRENVLRCRKGFSKNFKLLHRVRQENILNLVCRGVKEVARHCTTSSASNSKRVLPKSAWRIVRTWVKKRYKTFPQSCSVPWLIQIIFFQYKTYKVFSVFVYWIELKFDMERKFDRNKLWEECYPKTIAL